ncbi:MAG: disulfide bond formation protein B [Pseudomonadota bacterium]|nr:disulfide bond formation protein B [Pseudomonadota bacterium]
MKFAGITIRDRTVPLWAMGASAAALVIALLSQHWGDLPPCDLCLWQRIPHGVVIVIGMGALLWFDRPQERMLLSWLGAIAFSVGACIALYHVGIEQHWIQEPISCSGDATLNEVQSVDKLRNLLLATRPVRCDEIPWSLFGLSIAAWNALVSTLLALICGLAGLRQLREKTE